MTNAVDVKNVVLSALSAAGCVTSEGANAVMTVTTPEGVTWHFTVPQVKDAAATEPKVVVNVVFSEESCDLLNDSGRINRQVLEDFHTYEFDTQAEADAFTKGVEEASGWMSHLFPEDDLVKKLAVQRELLAAAPDSFDRDTFAEFVASHGNGDPTEEGYKLGQKMIAKRGDYAEAAFEVVYRGLTTQEPEDADASHA